MLRKSEYEMQAYVNECLNRQHGLDSPEGSAALTQANKPEVDGTDIQKAQVLAKFDNKQSVEQSLTPEYQNKLVSRPKSPIQATRSPNIKRS